MKEIKFRAWSKRNKKMYYIAENIGTNTYLEMNNYSWGVFNSGEHNDGAAICNNHYGDVLMQYIGKIDREAREIYEGDIVIIRDGQIDEDDGFFVIRYDKDTARFVLSGKSLEYDFDSIDQRKCEIAGNVYENSALLD